MDIRTFEGLIQPDLTMQAIVPYERDAAIRFIQERIVGADLCADVPDEVRKHFERSRSIFAYGYFCYEIFTVAAHNALLTVELALRQRLTEMFPARAEEFERAAFFSLQRTAEQAGLLADEHQDNAQPLRRLRNTVGHPTYAMTLSPPMASDLLSVVAGLINHLWRPDDPNP